MPSAFLSHAHGDRYFVNLLLDVLQFHGVDAWSAVGKIEPGEEYQREIEMALERADTMLVVVSGNALASKWVVTEVARFLTPTPSRPIIPLVLDGTSPEEVAPGLRRMHALAFHQCMHTAFGDLLGHFGVEFLSRRDFVRSIPRAAQRRSGGDRRGRDERRLATMAQRLRKGCWIAYARDSSYGKFDEVSYRVKELRQVESSLRMEVERYRFYDSDDKEVEPGRALALCAHVEWEDTQRSRRSVFNTDTFKPIYLVEGIAERLSSTYRVEPKDRRDDSDRRSSAERREKPG